MANIVQNLGKIVPNHRGSFKPDVQYRVMDEVFYFGASYRAVESPPLGTIPTNEDYWVIVSESSARLTNIEITDTSEDGKVTLKFYYEDLTSYEVTTGTLMPDLVNPDWEASSGPAQILNKPNLGTAAYALIGTEPGNVADGAHRHDNASTSVDGFLSKEDKLKLNSISSGATTNQTDSYLLNRANHTGSQSISTITSLQSVLDSKVNTSVIGANNGVAALNSQGKLPQSQGGGQPVLSINISSSDLTPAQLHTALNHTGFYKIAAADGSPVDFPSNWNTTSQTQGIVEGYISPTSTYVFSYQIITGSTGNRWIRRATNSTTWTEWSELASALTATPSSNGLMSAADKTKLNSVESGATANNTNNFLLNRTNHTGVQNISTISGLQAALDSKFNKAGSNTVTAGSQFVSTGSIADWDTSALQVTNMGASNAGAHLLFHRNTSFACCFGLDIDNKLKVGGFSMGNNAYEIYHQGNFNPSNYLPFSGGMMDTNAFIGFGTSLQDKIYYYSNTFGVGVESSALTNWSPSIHRWRIGGTSVSSGTEYMQLNTSGLAVTGNIYATGEVTAYSDIQLKSNIETIDGALDKVSSLRGVYYTKDDKRSIGVIAQEVKEVIPEVVRNSGEYLTVAYGNIVGVLIEAIKELKAEIDELKGSK